MTVLWVAQAVTVTNGQKEVIVTSAPGNAITKVETSAYFHGVGFSLPYEIERTYNNGTNDVIVLYENWAGSSGSIAAVAAPSGAAVTRAANSLEELKSVYEALADSVSTTAVANGIPKYSSQGRLKAAAGAASDDVAVFGQLAAGAFGPDLTSFGFAAEAIAMPNNDFAQITDKTAHYFSDVNSLNGPPVPGNYQVFALSRTDTAGDVFNYGSVLCIHRDNGNIYNASVNNGVWTWYLNFSTKNLGTVVPDSASVNGTQDAVKFRTDKGGVDFSNDTTGGVNPITFFNPNGAVGSISTSGTATSYNTSSDPRLKTPVPGAISDADINAKFNALLSTFLRFHWINDPSGPEVWGFDAHAVIDAGLDMGTEGDGPRESQLGAEYEPAVYDGDELVTPAKVVTPAGVDQAKAVPILLQKIAQLESRLAVLEGN
mgnify:CR=1 FL=1